MFARSSSFPPQFRPYARRNLFTSSSDLSVSPWVIGALATCPFNSVNPQGFRSYKLTESSVTTGTAHSNKQSIASIPVGTYVSAWVEAKAVERDRLVLIANTLASAGPGIRFDLTAGTFTTHVSGNSIAGQIIALGGGWYRCGIEVLADSASTGSIEFRIASGTSTNYAGTVGNGLLIAAPYSYIGRLHNYRFSI